MGSVMELVRQVRRRPLGSWLERALDEPGVESMQLLAGIDPEELDEYDRVTYLKAWAASRDWVEGQLQPALVAVAGRRCRLLNSVATGSKDVGVEEVRLALRTGEGYAGDLVRVARDLATTHAGTREAFIAGRFGWQHARAMVEETSSCDAEQVAAVEARCLPRAAEQTPRAFRMCVRRAVARLRPREEARAHKEAAAQAGVTRFEDRPGLAGVALRADPVGVQSVYTAWDLRARVMRAQARADGTDDGASMDVWRARAAVDLAEDYLADPGTPQAHGRPVSAVVVAGLPTLLGQSGQSGELRGYGPLPAPVAAELAAAAQRWLAVVTDADGTPLHVERYQPSQPLRDWIGAVWEGCAAPGCTRPRHLTQDDHNVPYQRGGPTAEFNLDPYCGGHHQYKTDGVCRADPPGSGDAPVRRWWTLPSGHRYPIRHPRLLPDDGDDPDGDEPDRDPPGGDARSSGLEDHRHDRDVPDGGSDDDGDRVDGRRHLREVRDGDHAAGSPNRILPADDPPF